MKKYLLMAAVAISALMSSCSNDDIPVNQAVTFKLELETVVSPFTSTIEYYPGELVNLNGDQLRVRLLAYDSEGNLASSDVQYFTAYSDRMTSNLNLAQGTYTIVAISDCIFESGEELWKMSGEEKLSTLTMTDEGYIGGATKIIGMSSQKVTIGSGSREYTLNLKPIGALASVIINNPNALVDQVDIVEYGLFSNKSCNKLNLSANTDVQYATDSDANFRWETAGWYYNGEQGHLDY